MDSDWFSILLQWMKKDPSVDQYLEVIETGVLYRSPAVVNALKKIEIIVDNKLKHLTFIKKERSVCCDILSTVSGIKSAFLAQWHRNLSKFYDIDQNVTTDIITKTLQHEFVFSALRKILSDFSLNARKNNASIAFSIHNVIETEKQLASNDDVIQYGKTNFSCQESYVIKNFQEKTNEASNLSKLHWCFEVVKAGKFITKSRIETAMKEKDVGNKYFKVKPLSKL